MFIGIFQRIVDGYGACCRTGCIEYPQCHDIDILRGTIRDNSRDMRSVSVGVRIVRSRSFLGRKEIISCDLPSGENTVIFIDSRVNDRNRDRTAVQIVLRRLALHLVQSHIMSAPAVARCRCRFFPVLVFRIQQHARGKDLIQLAVFTAVLRRECLIGELCLLLGIVLQDVLRIVFEIHHLGCSVIVD